MKMVVDTNIIFSAILNTNRLIGELLFNTGNQFGFYSPKFMMYELYKYQSKLVKHTKMDLKDLTVSIHQMLKNIKLISPEAISELNWKYTYKSTSEVDEKDTPFVATALDIKDLLWTGGKKLINGLKNKGFKDIYSTSELIEQTKDRN